jgi:predicted RNA binding protein with dsRBD fold (UPF0201 family)
MKPYTTIAESAHCLGISDTVQKINSSFAAEADAKLEEAVKKTLEELGIEFKTKEEFIDFAKERLSAQYSLNSLKIFLDGKPILIREFKTEWKDGAVKGIISFRSLV